MKSAIQFPLEFAKLVTNDVARIILALDHHILSLPKRKPRRQRQYQWFDYFFIIIFKKNPEMVGFQLDHRTLRYAPCAAPNFDVQSELYDKQDLVKLWIAKENDSFRIL